MNNPLNDPDYYSRERVAARKKEQRRQRRRKDLLALALITVIGVGSFGLLRVFVGEGRESQARPATPSASAAGPSPSPAQPPPILPPGSVEITRGNLAGVADSVAYHLFTQNAISMDAILDDFARATDCGLTVFTGIREEGDVSDPKLRRLARRDRDFFGLEFMEFGRYRDVWVGIGANCE